MAIELIVFGPVALIAALALALIWAVAGATAFWTIVILVAAVALSAWWLWIMNRGMGG